MLELKLIMKRIKGKDMGRLGAPLMEPSLIVCQRKFKELF